MLHRIDKVMMLICCELTEKADATVFSMRRIAYFLRQCASISANFCCTIFDRQMFVYAIACHQNISFVKQHVGDIELLIMKGDPFNNTNKL